MNKTYNIDKIIDGHGRQENSMNTGVIWSDFDNRFKGDEMTENEKSVNNDGGKISSIGETTSTSNIRTTSFRKYFSADGDLVDDIDSEVKYNMHNLLYNF